MRLDVQAGLGPQKGPASVLRLRISRVDALRPSYNEAVNAVVLRYGLTARQIDVLALLGKGGTKRKIAEELGISHETVKVHMRNVYAALDVHSQETLCTILAAQEQALDQQAGCKTDDMPRT